MDIKIIIIGLIIGFILVRIILGGEDKEDYIERRQDFNPSKIQASLSEIEKKNILHLIREGKKIEAIKEVRQIAKSDLKEAKDYVEYLSLNLDKYTDESEANVNGSIEKFLSEGQRDEIINLILEGDKIQAIKRLREFTGAGLKEAKEYVDSLSEKAPY